MTGWRDSVTPTQRRCRIALLAVAWVAFAVGAPALAEVQNVSVPASVPWTDTGIDLQEGDLVTIRSIGLWSNGGDAPQQVGPAGAGNYSNTTMPDAPLAALIGRIGSVTFLVGSGYQGKAPASGRLYLGMNDVPGAFGDNTGALRAFIYHVSSLVPLPNFVGKTFDFATVYLKERGLVTERQMRPSERPSGEVLDQYPKPGVDARTIKGVTLVVSDGSLPTTTTPSTPPPVTTNNPALYPSATTYTIPTALGPGVVVTPECGSAPLKPCPSPSVTATPTLRVPLVVGLIEAHAAAVIEKNGLSAVRRGEELSRREPGQVTRTEPGVGTVLTRGSSVGFWVAAGKNVVPSLHGRSVDESKALLRENGFRLGAIAYQSSDNERVQRQGPLAGTVAPINSTVTITVGRRNGSTVEITDGTRNSAWILVLLVGSALAAAVAVIVGWRQARLVRTRSLLNIRPSLDQEEATSFPDGVGVPGPTAKIQAGLEPGEDLLEGDVPVVRWEVHND